MYESLTNVTVYCDALIRARELVSRDKVQRYIQYARKIIIRQTDVTRGPATALSSLPVTGSNLTEIYTGIFFEIIQASN